MYRFQRRFTRGGMLVMCSALLAAGLGVDLDQSLAYQLFSLLFVLLLISLAWSGRFKGRFEIHRSVPRLGSVGQRLTYSVRVHNLTPKVQAGLTLLEDVADGRLNLEQFAAVVNAPVHKSFRRARLPRGERAVVAPQGLPSIPAGGSATVSVQVRPLRRGPLRLTGSTVARPDPFGLVRAFVKVPAPDTIVILPRRYPVRPRALPGSLKYQQGGVALASSVGESEEFVSLREYRRGDPMRHIHWKSWARTEKPIIKEFQDEFFVRHALILDTFAERSEADLFEEAISVAASFACTLQTQESLLDLMFVGPQAFCFTAGRGLGQVEQLLEVLAAVEPCTEKPFSALETLVLQHVHTVSGCVCILMDWDEARQNLVQTLRAFGVPLMVLVVVKQKAKLLDAGPLAPEPGTFHVVEAGKTGETLLRL